jgi:hypothetical protein
VFYCLSHTYNPFCTAYFGDRVVPFAVVVVVVVEVFVQASLDQDPPILTITRMTDLALHYNPPNLSFPSI